MAMSNAQKYKASLERARENNAKARDKKKERGMKQVALWTYPSHDPELRPVVAYVPDELRAKLEAEGLCLEIQKPGRVWQVVLKKQEVVS